MKQVQIGSIVQLERCFNDVNFGSALFTLSKVQMLLALGYRLVRRQKVSFLWGVVLLYGGLTSLIFVFSDYPPFSQHILTSAYRLLAHLVALPLLAEHKAD